MGESHSLPVPVSGTQSFRVNKLTRDNNIIITISIAYQDVAPYLYVHIDHMQTEVSIEYKAETRRQEIFYKHNKHKL